MNSDIRRKYALDELRSIKKGVSEWHESLTSEDISLDTIFDEEALVTEILEKSNFQGGMRAIKRYARNFVKPKIIKELLRLYPIPKEQDLPKSFNNEDYKVDIDDINDYFGENF